MIALGACALAVAAATLVEILVPGRAVYHYGWFNVALAALTIVALASARKPFRETASRRRRIAILAIAFGAAIAGFSTVASGLLAPDNRTVVGAPGTSVRLDDLGGALAFPFANPDSPPAPAVALERPGRAPLPIGESRAYAGSFAMRAVPRDVLYVEARDARGGSLTVTQPSGTSFLSPVLLLQSHQQIPGTGLDVPFDSFAVPAAHRLVKAVFFTPAQAAAMPVLYGTQHQAVLFDVTDENDRPVARGFGVSRDGSEVDAGGIRLRAQLLAYPAVEIAAVPPLFPGIAGVVLVLGGLAATGRKASA